VFEPVFLAQQALNGLSFGALLFLLASGLTLVFGLQRIVNLAHGAFYMLGGYIGIIIATMTGNLLLAAIVSMIAVGVTALVVELGLLRFVRGCAGGALAAWRRAAPPPAAWSAADR